MMMYNIAMSRFPKNAILGLVMAAMLCSFLSPLSIASFAPSQGMVQSGECVSAHQPDIFIPPEWSFRAGTFTSLPSCFISPLHGGPPVDAGAACLPPGAGRISAAEGINAVAFSHIYLNNSHFRC